MASGMNVKGGLLRARFLFVVLNHGQECWNRVVERLDEEDREKVSEIAVDNWYSVELLDRLDKAIQAEIGGTEEDVSDQLGEFSATTSLSGPYSSLLSSDVHGFLSQSALIHRAYQNFGSASYTPLSETSGALSIKYDVAPPASFCISGSAYFRRSVELCGARAARISHTRCCSRGDPVCEFYITWQP